jgi:hypothetical protein
MTYFKVLKGNKSCHGGAKKWTLPVLNDDGTYAATRWTRRIANPVICKSGFHLTTDPMQWPAIGMAVYEAEPGTIHGTQADKIVTDRCRLLRPAPEMVPDWWHAVERFVTEEIPATSFGKPDGQPDPKWRLFTAPARDAAWDAAWDAARAAARDAAWDAAGDAVWAAARAAAGAAAGDAEGDAARAAARAAELYARMLVCDGLPLAQTHRDHIEARWRVWRKGYSLLCDVDGILYVYGVQ